MKISIGNKIFQLLAQIKISYWAIIFSFISCLNLWFIIFYLKEQTFFIKHGLIISFLISLALSTIWFLIFTILTIKGHLFVSLLYKKEISIDNPYFYYVVFAENMGVLGCFMYFNIIYNWSFISLVSSCFITLGIVYVLLELLSNVFFYKHILTDAQGEQLGDS